jgi:predicted Zn-dependent peptidase
LYDKRTLGNGLRIVTSKMPHIRSVSVAFFVCSGGCYETEKEAGISHFLEHLCFKGTEKRPSSREISEMIEGTGGSINAGTDKELTIFWCRVASQYLPLALDVLTDMLKNSRMNEDDIEKERNVIIEEINMNYDIPQQRADTLISELMWPGQPLGRDVAGTKDSVNSLTRIEIMDYYSAHYTPNNIVVSIAGDIDDRMLDNFCVELQNSWPDGNLARRFDTLSIQESPRLQVENRGIEQVHICLGYYGTSIIDPDRFAIDLFNIILGDGMSSRLFIELREKRGLVYEIESSSDHFRDAGDLMVHAGVDPKNVEESIKVILDQIYTLRDGITEFELRRAKELVKGRMLLAMEVTRNVSTWFGAQEVLNNKILSVDEVTTMVESVTLQDVTRVAGKLIQNKLLNLAVVGPLPEIGPIYHMLNID